MCRGKGEKERETDVDSQEKKNNWRERWRNEIQPWLQGGEVNLWGPKDPRHRGASVKEKEEDQNKKEKDWEGANVCEKK